MKDWQEKIIIKNKKELKWKIKPNTSVMASLESVSLITRTEKDALNAKKASSGEEAMTDALLDILVTKEETDEEPPTLAFDKLIEILDQERQDGASRLLKTDRDKYLKNQKLSNLPDNSPAKKTFTGVDSPDGNATENLIQEYLRLVEEDKSIDVKVEKPSDAMAQIFPNAKLLPEDKGVALIINIKEFDDVADASGKTLGSREGSEKDVEYMIKLWNEMGYEIYREKKVRSKYRWKREEVLEIVKDFKKACNSEEPESMVIFIGSHGEDGQIFTSDSASLPADNNKINVNKHIISEFYDEKCEGLKGKLKLVLVNACQVFSNTQSDALFIDGAVVTDMIVVTSQSPGHESYRNTKSGSWFVHCLTYFMMKCAKDLDLMSILNTVSITLPQRKGCLDNDKTKRIPSQTCTINQLALSNPKIYFFIEQK